MVIFALRRSETARRAIVQFVNRFRLLSTVVPICSRPAAYSALAGGGPDIVSGAPDVLDQINERRGEQAPVGIYRAGLSRRIVTRLAVDLCIDHRRDGFRLRPGLVILVDFRTRKRAPPARAAKGSRGEGVALAASRGWRSAITPATTEFGSTACTSFSASAEVAQQNVAA